MKIKAISGWRDPHISSASVPTADAYELWLRHGNRRPRNSKITGAKLRRAVIMRRQGQTWRECADATGLSASCLQDWNSFLPMGWGA